MQDPYSETVTFALFATMLGVVIFGGTTLAYFLAKRSAKLPPPNVRAQRLPSRSGPTTRAAENDSQGSAA